MNAITCENSKLGFIGVGYMGRPIAQRLLEAGFRLSAYDRHRTKAEALVPHGGTVAQSVAELSSGCDVLLSCLATDDAVLSIYKGADGEPWGNRCALDECADCGTDDRIDAAS